MVQNVFAEYYPWFFLIAGIAFISFSILWESKKSKLRQTGIHAKGIVLEQQFENKFRWSDSDNYQPEKNKITIRFLTENKDWITGTITQGFQLFYKGQYKDGAKIDVYYDRNNPSNFYADSKQTETTGRLVFGAIGVLLTLAGLYRLLI
ncbi:MAG: DUF3592 domain-containing protein [Agriterribacter sp.]